MAVEPQSHPGALAGAAAGPARRAVETPYAAAAALSHAPGIGAGNRPAAALRAMAEIATRCNRRREPNDPAAWGYAARSPMTGKIWRTTPPSRPDTSAARPRFSMQIARQLVSGGVEPFSFRPDKILPGTLHHSGNRPAPPSDHTPLARRSAFQQGAEARPAPEFGRARGVEIPGAKISAVPMRGEVFSAWNHGTLRFHSRSCGGVREIPVNHKGVEHTLTRSQTPGVLAVAISDRRPGQVGKDRGTACAVGHAPRRAEIDRELKHVARQLTS